MAGDWTKVEDTTPEKPEIFGMAEMLGIDPDSVFGKCFKFWRWASQHTQFGKAEKVSLSFIDEYVGCAGFSKSLERIGWLKIKKNGDLFDIVIPNFNRHISKSAKQRALTARRVAKHKRQIGNAEIKKSNDSSVTSALPREQRTENREEKSKEKRPEGEIPPLPPAAAVSSVSQNGLHQPANFPETPEGCTEAFWFFQTGKKEHRENIQSDMTEIARFIPVEKLLAAIVNPKRDRGWRLFQLRKHLGLDDRAKPKSSDPRKNILSHEEFMAGLKDLPEIPEKEKRP